MWGGVGSELRRPTSLVHLFPRLLVGAACRRAVPDWVFVCSLLCSPLTSCVGPCMYSCVLGSFPTLCICMEGVGSVGLVVPAAPVFCSLLENWHLTYELIFILLISSFTLVLVTVCIVPGLANINTVCVECSVIRYSSLPLSFLCCVSLFPIGCLCVPCCVHLSLVA